MFATRLKELRSKHSLTQLELSRELGTEEAIIKAYETMDKEPSLDKLIAIANYFKVSTDYLLDIDEANKKPVCFVSKGLHTSQIKILEFIISFKSSFGYSPSIREIAKGVGLASTSTVHSHLKKLEFLGYVKRNPEMTRSITVLNTAYYCK